MVQDEAGKNKVMQNLTGHSKDLNFTLNVINI